MADVDGRTDGEVRHEDWGGDELGQTTYTRVLFVEVDLTEAVTACGRPTSQGPRRSTGR